MFSWIFERYCLALLRLLEPLTFFDTRFCKHFILLREFLRYFGFATFSPFERTAKSFIPTSIPTTFDSEYFCFVESSSLFSTKILMKNFPVHVFETVAVLKIPLKLL